MKKILFLNSCVEWGGGEKWTFETAYALYQRGYDVVVGSTPKSELYQKSQKAGLKVKAVPVKNSLSVLNPYKLFSFINYLKKAAIDTIFLNLSQDLKFGGIAGKLADVDKVIYRRGSAIPIKDRFYTQFLLGDCVTDIIANSKSTQETILENTSQWLSEEKIEIIYNGIKLDQVKESGIKTDIRKEFGISQDEILIANVGRLSKQKGHEYLIATVKRLIDKGLDNFKVLVVGKGELESEIKKEVEDLGLNDYIIFTGFRTDIYNIMRQMDFLLHTALWEGFGFVIAEAMAVGKPVVSTDVSNISEIMVDGETGYLAESKNPDDIADKVIKMIDTSQRQEMGRLGKEIIENNFGFKKMIDRLEAVYL
ncbi:glycosyltransferase [Selenihalanaerobacter shriftii]|uniref:Glycosyltransferase involved in cell wall bisynthesis n=1 Tax=Selenihalanaerobacter shriftii TaxID=142842 RepID=A0A1T4KWW3_9FIRM|nr:glycosyltransferase [Selenihalanaerobacter shriftii]SJZ46828.1 Glycosyltransferase involved in cell wall bisynthesis [Selenihalanaerobacter shriftii]